MSVTGKENVLNCMEPFPTPIFIEKEKNDIW
jgi:hypothetical protein